MSDFAARRFAGFEVERSTEQAWRGFQARLGDYLVEMTAEDSLVVEVQVAYDDLEGAVPYVQFAGSAAGMLRGEVASNTYLDDRLALDDVQSERLLGLGWQPPTTAWSGQAGTGSPNFHVDVERRQGYLLAAMAVRTLREVLGVVHPAFLDVAVPGKGSASDLFVEPDAAAGVTAGAGPVADPDPSDGGLVGDGAAATVPESEAHLRSLVASALATLFDGAPEEDEDGDYPVTGESSVVYVRVEKDAPVVTLLSVVASGVTDLSRAAFEVNVLNRDLRFVTFALVGDKVLARQQLHASPFVPAHLLWALVDMSQRLDEVDEDLVARVGGRRAVEPDDDADASDRQLHGAESPLVVLRELDADAPGSVAPELAAGICDYDSRLVASLARAAAEREESWRTSRDLALAAGHTDEAAARDGEMLAWQRTATVLRKALRLVVERDRHPRARRLRAPRPPRPSSVLVEDAASLMDAYGVADLVALDEVLSAEQLHDVEVFDIEECVSVEVAGEFSGELDFPFTLAQFESLVRRLQVLAGGQQRGR